MDALVFRMHRKKSYTNHWNGRIVVYAKMWETMNNLRLDLMVVDYLAENLSADSSTFHSAVEMKRKNAYQNLVHLQQKNKQMVKTLTFCIIGRAI